MRYGDLLVCGFCAIMPAAAMASPSPYDDNFDDNTQAAAWSTYTQDPDKLTISETGGRLVASAVAPAYDHFPDALYQSIGAGGFKLATNADFSFRIDYSFGQVSQFGGFAPGAPVAFALDLGIGADVAGTQAMSIGYGRGGLANLVVTEGLFGAYLAGAVTSGPTPAAGTGASGTLYISYDSGLDTVYLSDAGYGPGSADYIYTGVVQGLWATDEVMVAFGARGNGFQTLDANSYLDNFVLESGTITAIPEPATLGLLAAGGLLLIRRK